MAVEKRKYKNRTTYRAYWRNPWTGKIEKGQSHDNLRDARREDSEIKVRLEYEPEYFRPDDMPDPGQGRSVSNLIALYLARTDLAPSTRKMDYYHGRVIQKHLGQYEASALTRDNLKKFEQAQLAAGIKQNTIQRRISVIRAVLNWAAEQGLINENPAQGYRCKRGHDLRLPPPSPGEIKLMLEAAQPHLRRAIILSYYLGVRVGASELLNLQWADFDEERRRMRVWSARKNKERPWRDIDLTESVFQTLLAWQAEDKEKGLTHLITFREQPIKSIKRAWGSMMRELAKEGREHRITRRIRPYDLRHAFATESIAAGADIKAVADLMGHANTNMIHHHYQHVVDEQKRKVVESIPDVLTGVRERGTSGTFSGDFTYPDKKILQ